MSDDLARGIVALLRGIEFWYDLWVAASFAVIIVLTPFLVRRARLRDFSEPFLLALSIWLTWVGGGLITRTWWAIWRRVGGPDGGVLWMNDHWVVLFGASLVFLGALGHIWSFSAGARSLRKRVIAFGVIGVFALMSATDFYWAWIAGLASEALSVIGGSHP